MPSDKIILQDKPSIVPILVIWPVTGIIFAGMFGCIALTVKSVSILSALFIGLGVIAAGLSTIRMCIELIRREFTTYILTENHLIYKAGILNQDHGKISLDRIEGTEIQWPLAGRLLNYATIIVGTSGSARRIRSVPNPQKWEGEIDKRSILKTRS